MLDAANKMIRVARDRVYKESEGPNMDAIPILEEQPKWSVLQDVLNEVCHETMLADTDAGIKKTLFKGRNINKSFRNIQ